MTWKKRSVRKRHVCTVFLIPYFWSTNCGCSTDMNQLFYHNTGNGCDHVVPGSIKWMYVTLAYDLRKATYEKRQRDLSQYLLLSVSTEKTWWRGLHFVTTDGAKCIKFNRNRREDFYHPLIYPWLPFDNKSTDFTPINVIDLHNLKPVVFSWKRY